MQDREYWLSFSNFSGIGPTRFKKLLLHFGSAKEAWQATEKAFAEAVGPALAAKFIDFRQNFSISNYKKRLEKAQVNYLTLEDVAYPQLLKQTHNAPFVLYYRGSFDFSNDTTIGVVGARRVSPYGEQVTQLITSGLVSSGCVIVSGLALGVDAIAHQTTLAEQGKTVAVLGCGVDCCYPQENTAIYAQIIAAGGAIVSEYPLSFPPTVGSFPSRNRIIAGLSRGIVVTEGTVDSGSLITARDAFANNRPVFAVPGPINSRLSTGPYTLLKQGATLVTKAEDIVEALGLKSIGTKSVINIKGDTEDEQQIIDLLAEQEFSFDQLVRQTTISAGTLGGILSLMEMKGMIKNTGANTFILST